MSRTRRRIRGAGLAARITALFFSALALAVTPAYVVSVKVWAFEDYLVLVVVVLLSLLAGGRAMLIGVSVDSDELIARSWFVTLRLPVSQVVSVDVVDYAGMLNRGGTDGSRAVLKNLSISTPTRTYSLRGLIAVTRTVERQARELRCLVFGVEPRESPGRTTEPRDSPRRVNRLSHTWREQDANVASRVRARRVRRRLGGWAATTLCVAWAAVTVWVTTFGGPAPVELIVWVIAGGLALVVGVVLMRFAITAVRSRSGGRGGDES
ncbi:hypothetical protein MN032_00710 [Agromyces atrinae]|uniref:hypothetical protein n=1 Tax=Agromyces atrinae TaxID=592376 RepID=UPI001F5695B6|nr:hypothetical protein [Agromyces atrinae]MCI2956194.1 hypothetical protein [Agromyces atrinae]